MENLQIFVIGAVATIVGFPGSFEAFNDVGFGDIKNDDGLNIMTGAGGYGHDLFFFAVPATDGGKDKRVFE